MMHDTVYEAALDFAWNASSSFNDHFCVHTGPRHAFFVVVISPTCDPSYTCLQQTSVTLLTGDPVSSGEPFPTF